MLCWCGHIQLGLIQLKIGISAENGKIYNFIPLHSNIDFRDRMRLFFEADATLRWPRIFGVGMIEKWDFDPEVKNYDFAPQNFEADFRGRK